MGLEPCSKLKQRNILLTYLREHSWFDEVPLIAVRKSSCHQLGALFLAFFDQPQNLLKLLFVDLRTVLVLCIKRISYCCFIRSFCALFNEAVVNGVLDEGSGSGTAALPLKKKFKIFLFR